MDAAFPTELPAFLDFCKSLDVAIVQTPEQALELFRTGGGGVARRPPASSSDLGGDLRRLRQQIVASGVPLLDEAELDRERAVRRGDKPLADDHAE